MQSEALATDLPSYVTEGGEHRRCMTQVGPQAHSPAPAGAYGTVGDALKADWLILLEAKALFDMLT